MRWMDYFVKLMISLIVLGGGAMVWYGSKNMLLGYESRSWPRGTGTVKKTYGGTPGGDSIVVAYKAADRDLETATISFGHASTPDDSSETEMLRLRYPKAAKVNVSVSPSNPALAVVRPGVQADSLLLPGIGVLIMLIGIMFFVFQANTGGFGVAILLFGSVFFLMGGAMLGAGSWNIWQAYESASWPVAQGEIVYGQVDSNTHRDEDDVKYTTMSGSLVFRYEVDGIVHYSNLRTFGKLAGSSDAEWATAIVEKFPKGAKVPVHYSAIDPDIGVIETGISDEAYFLPGAGAAVLLFGLAAMTFGRKALS